MSTAVVIERMFIRPRWCMTTEIGPPRHFSSSSLKSIWSVC